jgi:uncharacterized caspase-like protein
MLHAVVVGVNEFSDPDIGDLAYARADAEAVAGLLRDRIDEKQREVHLLVDKAATKRRIMELVAEELPRIEAPGDVVLVYFACHGSPEMVNAPNRTSLYLIVHDTVFDRIFSTGIEMARELPEWLSRLQKAELVLVVLDACFSGSAGGRTFEGPMLRRYYAGARAPTVSLKEIDFGRGRLIMSAAGDNEPAQELDELKHGVFTHCLLEALKRPAGEDKAVGVYSLYEKVATCVAARTARAQQPTLTGWGVLPSFPLLG